jgi:cell division transport system permease protein
MDSRGLRRVLVGLRSGLRGVRSTPLVFAASVSTMAGGLLVLAGYLLVVQNLRDVLTVFGDELRLVAFLTPGESLAPAAADELAERVGGFDGVAEVHWVPPDTALERLRMELGPDSGILEGLERNPLPGSLELEIAESRRKPEELRTLVALIGAEPEIEEVRYGEDWVEGYTRVVRMAEWLGLALTVALVVILGAISAGTVRLTVHARADEIQIQRLVGAGGLFVRLPFCLEGALQGGVAAALALLALYGLWALGLPVVGEPLEFLLGQVTPRFFGAGQVVLLLLLGTGLGLGGAVVSLLNLEEAP